MHSGETTRPCFIQGILACSFIGDVHFHHVVKGCPMDSYTVKLLSIPFLISQFGGKHFAIIKCPVSYCLPTSFNSHVFG